MPEQIAAMGRLATSTDWLASSGRPGNGDWHVDRASAFTSLANSDDIVLEQYSIEDMLQKISVDAYNRNGALFVEVKTSFVDPNGPNVKTIEVLAKDGEALPDWAKVIRPGFLSANPPADLRFVDLEVIAVLDKGGEIAKLVRVDLSSGTVVELETLEDEPLEPSSELASAELRGSLESDF